MVATDNKPRPTSTRAARPAAAADGSKWPMFDFSEAQCTVGAADSSVLELTGLHSALAAAPT